MKQLQSKPENGHEAMEALLQQWRNLSRMETDAIHSGAWVQLTHIHAEKRELQQNFDRLESTLGASKIRAHFAQTLRELFTLEQQNLALLASARSRLNQQYTEADKAAQTLRTLQKAYTFAQPSHWHSYS